MRWSAEVVGDDPDSQVFHALETMSRYVREDVDSWPVRSDARAALEISGGDPILGAYLMARRRIPFQEDQVSGWFASSLYGLPVVEVFVRPVDMSLSCSSGGCLPGDCDDFSMYVAALLAANGVEPRFAVIAADPGYPKRWSHVYVVAYPEEPWHGMYRVPVDASHGPYPGWEYPGGDRLMEYRIFPGWKSAIQSVLGIACVMATPVLIYGLGRRE